ncbi:ankyrin repeat-containing protein [Largemouth bass ulcerative syndrome virus]|nr:ankyrin repeat containing protein [Spotted knifejaw iridovirus]WEP24614.1 ankyrin repeat-containing protein [Largemouth bass ulcerative syndrome virus]
MSAWRAAAPHAVLHSTLCEWLTCFLVIKMDSLVDLIRAGGVPDVAQYADQVDEYNAEGFTPLMVAVEAGNVGAVHALLTMGADPNDGHAHGHRVPLIAAVGGPWDVFVALLQSPRLRVNARNSSHETALHYAADTGNAQAAEALLRAGADVNATDILGNSPLFAAITNVQVASMLMHAGADVNIVNNADHTFIQNVFEHVATADDKHDVAVPMALEAMRHGLRMTATELQRILDVEHLGTPFAVTIVSTLDNVDMGMSHETGHDAVQHAVATGLTAVTDFLVGLLHYDVDSLVQMAVLGPNPAVMIMLIEKYEMDVHQRPGAQLLLNALLNNNVASARYLALEAGVTVDPHDVTALITALMVSQNFQLVKDMSRHYSLDMVTPIDGRSPLDLLVSTVAEVDEDFIVDFITYFTPRQGVSLLTGHVPPYMYTGRVGLAYTHMMTLRNMAVGALPWHSRDSAQTHIDFGVYKTL